MLRKYSPEIFFIFTVVCNNVIRTREAKNKLQSDASNNITFVNKALYDFFNNYDRIIKVLKSKEELRNDLVTLHDDDSNDSSYEKTNVTQKNWFLKQVNHARASTFRPVTALIYENEQFDDDITEETSKQAKSKARNTTDTSNISLGYVKEDTDDESSDYNESEDIQIIPIDVMSNTESNENKITTKKIKKVMKSDKPKVFKNILGEKTRFSVQSLSSSKSRKNYSRVQRHFRAPLNLLDNRRRIKKVVYSETFSPNNIWQEIISRPIKLNNDNDPFFKPIKPRSETKDKITIVILTKQEMDDENTHEDSVKLAIGNKSKPTNDSLFRNRKPILLRSTYGDACLKVPIEKCNKVLKAVIKKVCKVRFKCKSDLKSKFIKIGKRGCTKNFLLTHNVEDENNFNDIITKGKNKDKINPLHLRKNKHNGSYIEAKDIIPENNYDFIIYSNNKTLVSITSPKSLYLRDKYEIACQKYSREKCIKTCNATAKQICSEYSCEKNKRKAFSKSCTEECKNIFIVLKDSDKESSESDDSDSSDSD